MKADRNGVDAIVQGTSGSRSARAFTLWVALFFLIDVAGVNGLGAWLSPGGFADTALQQSWDMLHGVGGDDSWGPMASALDYLYPPPPDPADSEPDPQPSPETAQIGQNQAADPSPPEQTGPKTLYQAIFFDQGIKFQYPPSALFALQGMYLFGKDHVRTFDETVFTGWPPVNDLIGWTFLFLTAVSAAALMEFGLRRTGTATRFDAYAALRMVLAFGFTLSFYPVVKAFTLGQIQLWINSLFAIGMLLFLVNQRIASGILMGLVCLMKPHYGLFTVWGVLNREWRFTAACVLIGAIGLFFSIWVYGWANHTDYLRVLSFMSERGESYYPNQSINGLLNRLASLSAPELYANVNFDAFRFPPYKAWVYWGTVLTSAVILLTGLLRRSSLMNRALAFAVVAVSLTLASPIAWEHHYGVLFPAFALMAGALAAYPARLAALGLSYIFVSNFIPVFNLLALTPFNVLQSYTLAGGLALLILMHFHLTRLQSRRPAPQQVSQ